MAIPPQSQYPSAFARWYSIAILILFYIISVLDRSLLPLQAQAIQNDLKLSDVQLGLLEGVAFALLYASAGLALGWALDRYSRRLIIFWGIFAWCVSCALAGFAENFETLFLSRLGVGIGEAALLPGAYSIIRDIFPSNRLGTPIGVFTIGAGLGVAFSYLGAGTLIHVLETSGHYFGALGAGFKAWQMTFLVAGLCGLPLAFLIFLVPEPRRQQTSNTSSFLKPIITCFRENPVLLPSHIFGFAALYMCVTAVLSWSPIYLARKFGWQTQEVAYTLAVCFGLAPVMGSVIAGIALDRLFVRGVRDVFFRGMAINLALVIPVIIVCLLSNNQWLAIVAMGLFGFMIVGTYSSFAITALQLIAPPGLNSRLVAVYLFILYLLGYGGGPLIVGALTDHVLLDRSKVDISISVTLAVAGTASILIFLKGMPAMRAKFRPA